MSSAPTVVAAVARMVAHVPGDARTELLADPVAAMEQLFPPLRLRAVDLSEAFGSGSCSCDGYYATDITPDVPWILFRPDVVAARLLFTLLHELGHHLIRHMDPDLLDAVDQLAGPDGDPEDTEELLCHEFASEMLIPTSMLDAVIGAQRPEPRHVAMLRDASGASWEAAAVRVAHRLAGRGAVVLIRTPGFIGFSVPSAALRAPWPEASVLDPEGPLSFALYRESQRGEDTFRWGLDGALRLPCVTARIHDHLAIGILADERLSGPALLDRIRGIGVERPTIEPAVAIKIYDALEVSVSPWIDRVPPDVVVRVNKTAISQVLTCERHLVACKAAPVTTSPDLVRGRLLDRLFVQLVHGFAVGTDPVSDALEAATADGDASLSHEWHALSTDEQSEVTENVRAAAQGLHDGWPMLPPNAFVRVQEPLRVDLAEGRVVLSGRVDLMVGVPNSTHVGTTIIDAKSGRWSYHDAADAAFYSLLETVRHGAPPFQAGTYYMRDGTLDLSVVDLDWLTRGLARTTEAISLLVRLATGEPPRVTPNGLCPWCPAVTWCAEGRRFVNRADAENREEIDGIDDEEPDEDR